MAQLGSAAALGAVGRRFKSSRPDGFYKHSPQFEPAPLLFEVLRLFLHRFSTIEDLFLIDGFNLYHSIRNAMTDNKLVGGRWLDIYSLCRSYIYLFGTKAVVQDVLYFSALATHRPPQTIVRHKALIGAMQSTGVQVVLGKFKRKEILCRAGCGKTGWRISLRCLIPRCMFLFLPLHQVLARFFRGD